MQLKRLKLANVRVFEQAEFEFQPGMNLLVGINGAGKSTVLDVLRIMLSQSLPKFTVSRSRPIPFEEKDITTGQRSLTAELSFEAAGIAFEHLVHKPREKYVIDKSGKGQVRDQTYNLVNRNELTPDGVHINKPTKKYDEQPIAVYFSTGRSSTMRQPGGINGGGSQVAAFAGALSHNRTLRLRDFAEWWLVQEELAGEIKSSARRLNVFNETVMIFLDDYTNLRAVREPETILLIDKGDITLDLSQLSDGERSMIALVFDLALRLLQANPKL
ncbi:MAG: AAA family ATPase, partial [Planctomycetes bacterium]|nr:AAA family ATPase [Planctomycetota bacterium]